MNAILRRAAAKKQKYFAKKTQFEKEQEDNLSDVDEMEVSENMLGKLFNDRYITLKYLGSGTFSKVWLVYDVSENSYYAMKMYYPKYQEDGEYEVRFLNRLRNCINVVKMHNNFIYTDPELKSPNNISICLIVELMGRSLMKIYDIYDKGVSFDVFKNLSHNALVSLNEIHENGLIHTDIKLENLMLQQLTGDVKAIIEWFQKLQPEKLHEQYTNMFIPPNWQELGQNKRKKLKRVIKTKAAKKLANHFHKSINDHVNEMNQFKVDFDNQDSNDEQTSNESLEVDLDDEMPELVNLEEVKEIENQQLEEEQTELGHNEYLNDDELDMDLINTSVKIADLGNACDIDNIDDEDIQIRSYRAPEVVMGEMYNEKVDVWSMACLFYELLTHDNLFNVDSEHDENIEQDRLLLSQMYSVLGKMPVDECIDCERTYDLFDEKGRVKKFKKIDYHPLEDRIKEKRPDLSETEINHACQLIKNMMTYNVKQRLSAKQCLSMPIFTSDYDI